MRPHVTLLMEASLDGGLHPSRWTASPDGGPRDWSRHYETIHEKAGADAWLVGRVTMAEMSKVEPRATRVAGPATRPVHVARRDARRYAVATDRAGRLGFASGEVGGDHVVVLLGAEVPDGHLAYLAETGVSYVVSAGPDLDLAAALGVLRERFGIERLMLEGGARVNGSFLAAGLVDEIEVLVAPALDGDPDGERIVAHPGGLAGRCELSFVAAVPVGAGAVHLRYRVASSTGSVPDET